MKSMLGFLDGVEQLKIPKNKMKNRNLKELLIIFNFLKELIFNLIQFQEQIKVQDFF
jgi:hypothetical protein